MRQKRQEQEGGSRENGQFLTTNEVAEILRVHQRTVQRWISSHRLRVTKVGPKILRVHRQDLNEFLESQNKDRQEEAEN